MNNNLILEYMHFSKTTRPRFEILHNWENTSKKLVDFFKMLYNLTLVSFIDQFKKNTFFYTWPLGVTQKSKAHSSSTHVSAKKVLKFNYLSISEPFAVVDAIVCFFKSQIFQKRIFWVVNKKRSHGHSLLSGDTPGRLQVYWAEIQQLTMNPTASQHK